MPAIRGRARLDADARASLRPGQRQPRLRPDTGTLPTSKLVRGADVLVIDGSTRERTFGGHLAMSDTVAGGRSLRAGQTYFTHVGHRTGTHAELDEWLPDGYGVAFDGMPIDIGV